MRKNVSTNYTISIKPRAVKSLKKIPKQFAEKIDLLIKSLALNPRPTGCIKLEGYYNAYRVRYTDYRIIYTIEDRRLIIDVVSIGDRKEIYKGV